MHKLTIFFAFCGRKNSQGSLTSIAVDEIVRQEIGDNFERKDRKEYSLCILVSKKTSERWRTILVVNKNNGAIEYGPKKMNADVDWHAANDKGISRNNPGQAILQDLCLLLRSFAKEQNRSIR